MVSEKVRQKIDAAIKLQNQDKFEDALFIFLNVQEESSEDIPIVNALIAGVYNLQDKYPEAITYYKKYLSVNPNSEFASTGLFHCLNGNKMADEALEEMKRYLTDNPYPLRGHYKAIIEDLIEDIDDPILKDYKSLIIKQGKRFGSKKFKLIEVRFLKSRHK